ncbi:MAG TPA: hypothetical protein VFX01_05335 [Methylophilaceae bacterium]|nr:hypothetical protein [Methylophilaceae bacterium]
MFKAKGGKPTPIVAKRTWLIVGIGLLLLLSAGIGFYSYLASFDQPTLVAVKPAPSINATVSEPHLQAQPQSIATEATTPVAEPVAAKTAEGVKTASADAMSTTTALTAADHNAAAPKSEGASQSSPQSPTAQPSTTQPPLPQSSSPQPPSAQPQQLAFGEPVTKNEQNSFKVTRNTPVASVNPAVLSAYQALMAGNDAVAQSLYWQVLHADARNTDALLGMAAIATRQGRKNDAAGWYGKVMEIEPRNTVAQAAMISLLAEADPVSSESRIKNLLAQKPESAYLHAALGNLYAEQNQWPSAQQAYFDAYHLDKENAEYAFNLAVSLDHLGKSSLALQYYKEAQTLLSNSAVTKIDRAQLESRIAQLQ